MSGSSSPLPGPQRFITLFLCGDVMTGRGIDQVLPRPGDPRLHEPYVKDARDYVKLAERRSGPVPKPAAFSYIWGEALEELSRERASWDSPDLRIVNLETSVTTSSEFWPGKGIHYRMHPGNVACLTEARIDCCLLANNHTLDWGYAGLSETMEVLAAARIRFAGAGRNRAEAAKPAVFDVKGKGRVIFFALGTGSSGVPAGWAAEEKRPGVNRLPDLSGRTLRQLVQDFRAVKQTGDILVVSIHWGGNWGYEVPAAHQSFAHQLIDEAGVDVVYGHSSHHARPIEVHDGKLILYGCGDFINDYEGIGGHEEFRDELRLMYFASLDPVSGRLAGLQMTLLQARRFRLERASSADALWVRGTLNRHSQGFGSRLELGEDGRLRLRW
jgi:poly-gamma-glutamate capsule biosynthesis protein CapA/YwtB (metallophosphatase superfamily)